MIIMENNIILLEDENGVEIEFEVIDVFEMEPPVPAWLKTSFQSLPPRESYYGCAGQKRFFSGCAY